MTATQRAQHRYVRHVIDAQDCACATGGWCPTARRLDEEAEAAWRQVG